VRTIHTNFGSVNDIATTPSHSKVPNWGDRGLEAVA